MSEATVEVVETEETEGSEDLKGLRSAASKGKKDSQENVALKRELAFLKAGINTEDPRFKYFVKGYEGDLTKEAVLAEATAAGLIQQAQQQQTPEQQANLAAEQRVVAASAGGAVESQGLNAGLAQLDDVMAAHGKDGVMAVLANSGIPIN